MAKYGDDKDVLPNTVRVIRARTMTWGRDVTHNIHEINIHTKLNNKRPT